MDSIFCAPYGKICIFFHKTIVSCSICSQSNQYGKIYLFRIVENLSTKKSCYIALNVWSSYYERFFFVIAIFFAFSNHEQYFREMNDCMSQLAYAFDLFALWRYSASTEWNWFHHKIPMVNIPIYNLKYKPFIRKNNGNSSKRLWFGLNLIKLLPGSLVLFVSSFA